MTTLHDDIKNGFLSEFSLRMRESGYSRSSWPGPRTMSALCTDQRGSKPRRAGRSSSARGHGTSPLPQFSSAPPPPVACTKEDFFIHSTVGKGTCRREGLVYKGICLTCKERGPSSEVDRDGRVRMPSMAIPESDNI